VCLCKREREGGVKRRKERGRGVLKDGKRERVVRRQNERGREVLKDRGREGGDHLLPLGLSPKPSGPKFCCYIYYILYII
jgi:hypothetical protein